MGISGLLQFLKDASEPINVKKYRGHAVAVDTYCWLHKGAFSCADKLAKGEPTDQYVRYCMTLVEMLLTYGVKPVLVFDGRNLPSKQEVEKARRERREANLQKGRQLLREGKLSAARDCFNRCVNITPAMAHNLIKAARARGVDCLVAPYEADAQLAFLTKSGLAEAVITEDSDLLAFGCKKVILKMDKHGNCLEIDQSNLGRCHNLGDVFTEEKFRYMCILSGCDYLASLYGIGLGKACKLLRIARDPDILKVIRKMGQYLKMDLVVPEHYIEGFTRANNTFLYQLVFDPVRRKVVPLNPYPENIDQSTLSYAGFNVGDDKGLQMALGNIDINTMERIDNFNPDKPAAQSKHRSRGWSDAPATTGRSIWCAGPASASAVQPRSPDSTRRPASTRGKERVISLGGLQLPSRELQVKRSREESGASDRDVLQQYSASGLKRSRPDQQTGRTMITRTRNCFATLLQRRNQEAEEDDDGQPTRSRFFGRSSSAASPSTEDPAGEDVPQNRVAVSPREDKDGATDSPIIQATDSDGPDPLSFDTPSPPGSSSSTSPGSACHGLRLFHWSEPPQTRTSTAGLTALQQFQYKKESSPSSPKLHRLSSQSSTNGNAEDNPSCSPPSQDSAYFSQSQPDDTSSQKEDVSDYAFSSSRQELVTFDVNTAVKEKSPPHSKKRSVSLGSKVSGLSKIKHESHNRAAKSPVLGPARVSGLRKMSVASGKKISSLNNENSPNVQATISNLWKNFSFKKDNVKVTSCREGESKPLSPVKDNVQPSTTTDTKLISSC